ncbi:MAG TPA: sodium:proton antiporter [Gemmatimonadaceae bacterium]|jgi:CPA1 family monovalent cation:H+ antiporter
MPHQGTLVLLLVVATIVSLAARRLRLPYTVVLVIAGLALGATHALAAPTLTRELMFGVLLPALVFEAAFDLDIEEIRRDVVTLAWLAVPGVVAVIVIVVVALRPLLELLGAPAVTIPTSSAALIFGALISATDPVAVVALFRALDAPRRLQVIVEAESLFNDGTAIIFFTLALAAGADGSGLTATTVTDFFYIIGGAIIVGGVIGFVSAEAMRRLYEPTLEVLLTTIAAYGSFAAAQGVGASGVIATVIAGLLCGSRSGRSGMSAMARIATATFWQYAAFVLNSLVFLSIGLMVQIPTLLEHWRLIVAAYLVVTLSRAVVTTGIVALLPDHLRLPRRWTAILSWGGLRGALSMVLALSIPESVPQRELIVTMTFGVVILSIFVQGITVSPALRWLGLYRPGLAQGGYAKTQAALLSVHSSLDSVDRTGSMVATDDEMRRALAAEYDEQLGHAEQELIELASQLGGGEAGTRAARHLLASTERQRVIEAFRSGAITPDQRDRLLAELQRRWWDDGASPRSK